MSSESKTVVEKMGKSEFRAFMRNDKTGICNYWVTAKTPEKALKKLAEEIFHDFKNNNRKSIFGGEANA